MKVTQSLCLLLGTIVVLTGCATNPEESGRDGLSPGASEPNPILPADNAVVSLPPLSAEMLSAGEPVTVAIDEDSCTVRYQAADGSVDELLELQTGEDTITWFYRAVGSAKTKDGVSRTVEGYWEAFAQMVGETVYALADEQGSGIRVHISAADDGLSIVVESSPTVSFTEETTPPARAPARSDDDPLSQRIRGAWLGSFGDQPMFVWVEQDSITYAYTDSVSTTVVKVDYTLSGSNLMGDEWERIDGYSRRTTIAFEGDTLIIEIVNDVPEGHENQGPEIYRLLRFSGTFPPQGWAPIDSDAPGPTPPEGRDLLRGTWVADGDCDVATEQCHSGILQFTDSMVVGYEWLYDTCYSVDDDFAYLSYSYADDSVHLFCASYPDFTLPLKVELIGDSVLVFGEGSDYSETYKRYAGIMPPPQWPQTMCPLDFDCRQEPNDTGHQYDPTDPVDTTSSLAARVAGVWHDPVENIWLSVNSDTIHYAYPSSDCYEFYTCNYSLVGDTLKGDEWEYIGEQDYPRVTTVSFRGDTLRILIENDIPATFDHPEVEIINAIPCSSSVPLDGWPNTGCGDDPVSSTDFQIEGLWSIVSQIDPDSTIEYAPSPDISLISFDSLGVEMYELDMDSGCYMRSGLLPYEVSGNRLKIHDGGYMETFSLIDRGDTVYMLSEGGFGLVPFAGEVNFCSENDFGIIIDTVIIDTGIIDTGIVDTGTAGRVPNDPADGFIAWYPFSGSFADETGNGHDGTGYANPLFVDDRFGVSDAACSFDGSNCVTIPLDNAMSISSITVSAWIKTDQAGIEPHLDWMDVVSFGPQSHVLA